MKYFNIGNPQSQDWRPLILCFHHSTDYLHRFNEAEEATFNREQIL